MGNKLNQEITSFELASKLSLKAVGDDIVIKHFSSITKASKGSITFCRGELKEELLKGVTLICKPDIELPDGCCCIYSNNPRLTFAKILDQYNDQEEDVGISEKAIISDKAILGNKVSIGHFSIVADGVIIKDNVKIGQNVTIGRNVIIGENTKIKSNSVIGEKGFGFEYDENELPVEFPQIGGVIIGSSVEIGALCTIASGTLDPTEIKDYVKIDDHVHIAHNVIVGEASVITACAEISGGVSIGRRVWIGPQASIINKCEIGDKSFIGIGAVVTKSVSELTLVAGNPAKRIRALG